MKIRKEMVSSYLNLLTMGRGASCPEPMSDLANFDADIRGMHKRAHQDGNLDWLHLSLVNLILNPEGRICDFAGQQYPFNETELVSIFKRAFEAIWPDKNLNEDLDVIDIKFENMSSEDWIVVAGKN